MMHTIKKKRKRIIIKRKGYLIIIHKHYIQVIFLSEKDKESYRDNEKYREDIDNIIDNYFSKSTNRFRFSKIETLQPYEIGYEGRRMPKCFPLKICNNIDKNRRLKSLISILPTKTRLVLELYFGIRGRRYNKLKISDKMFKSEEWVRLKIINGVEMLKRLLFIYDDRWSEFNKYKEQKLNKRFKLYY